MKTVPYKWIFLYKLLIMLAAAGLLLSRVTGRKTWTFGALTLIFSVAALCVARNKLVCPYCGKTIVNLRWFFKKNNVVPCPECGHEFICGQT